MTKYTVFLKDGQPIPIEANRIVEGYDCIAFMQVRYLVFRKTVLVVHLRNFDYCDECRSRTMVGALPQGVTAVEA